jgi:hypothetical protein
MNNFNEIKYNNWHECYYKHNLCLFEKLVNTIKKHNIKVKDDIYNKYFNDFCLLVYYNSSKRID